LTPAVLDDLPHNLGALHHGLSGLDFVAVRRQEDLVESDLRPWLALHEGELQVVACLGPELPATGLEYRVCHSH
jgi:hypothetical protein